MKKLLGLGLIAVLITASVSSEAFRKRTFSGQQGATWANDVDSISLTLVGDNRMFFSRAAADRVATWDRVVGIFDIPALVPVSAIDSLGKRDTVIVTLKAVGLNDLRIDTLQTDTLVVIRGKSELKYDLTNFVESVSTTQFALDSGGMIIAVTDSASTVNTTSVVTTTNRFSFELTYLTFDVHIIDSVMGVNDTATFVVNWAMEFIDEK